MAAKADPAVANAPGGEHWHFGAAMFGAVIAPTKLPALRQLADEYQPDLIVHAEVDVAAPLLAAERGLPSVTYGFAQPLDPNMLAALTERVAPLWRSAGLNPDPHAGIYRDRYLAPAQPACRASAARLRRSPSRSGPRSPATRPRRCPTGPRHSAAGLSFTSRSVPSRCSTSATSSRRSWPTSPTRT